MSYRDVLWDIDYTGTQIYYTVPRLYAININRGHF